MKKFLLFLAFVAGLVAFYSCEDNYEEPKQTYEIQGHLIKKDSVPNPPSGG
jgi:hypothetical protein